MRPIEGTEPRDLIPDELILDGQQRLTSLFQALMSGRVVATRDAKGNSVERWYYLDIAERCLRDPTERDETVLSVPAERTSA